MSQMKNLKSIDFQWILEERIKKGRFSILNSMNAFVANMLDAVEIIMMTILLPILKEEWNLSETEKVLFSQSTFFGMMIGLLIGGYLGDRFGRKFTLNLGIMLCCVFGFVSILSQNVV